MWRHYLVLSAKVLLRRKFFTAISIFGISFTLLVLMVVTAMLDHAFAPGAPELKQARTLTLANVTMRGPRARQNGRPGYKLLDRYARNLPGATNITFFNQGFAVTYLDGRKFGLDTKGTDAEFWQIYDFSFVEGAPYTGTDVEQGRRVAVISRSTADRMFGGAAVGRSFDLNGDAFRVVGVVDNVSLFRYEPYSQVWVPYTSSASTAYRTQMTGSFTAVALAEDTAGLQLLRDEFNSRMARIDRGDLGADYDMIVAPFETRFERFARNTPFGDLADPEPQGPRLLAFLVMLGLLFALIPTVNLINLNMSRILERASEIGVRKAFGARKVTLVGQFIVENLVLTLVGGAVGLALAVVVLNAINHGGLVPHSSFGINVRVFAYALFTAVTFGVMSGVYPAWRMSRLHTIDALKGGGE